MLACSSTDIAIRLAAREGTLRIDHRVGRFGPYAVIADQFGVIEVADDAEAAKVRIGACS